MKWLQLIDEVEGGRARIVNFAPAPRARLSLKAGRLTGSTQCAPLTPLALAHRTMPLVRLLASALLTAALARACDDISSSAMALPAKPPAKPASEWGPTPPAGWGPDSASDTLEILTGVKITSGGSVGSWELYTSGAGKVAMGIWEKDGAMYTLKCVDMLDVIKAGFSTLPGKCSFSAGDFIGIGQAGLGRVAMNQELPGVGAGVVQYSELPNPGSTVGQKTPPAPTTVLPSRQYAVKIVCSSAWGWTFLLLLLLGTCGYLGGSIAYGHKVQGQPLALTLPHREFWMEIKSLVEDGVAFSKSRALQASGGGGGGSGGAYEAVPDSEEPASSAAAASKKNQAAASAAEGAAGASAGSSSVAAAATGGSKGGVITEKRDESVHPSKAKISVVLGAATAAASETTTAAAAASTDDAGEGGGSSSEDDDELVE